MQAIRRLAGLAFLLALVLWGAGVALANDADKSLDAAIDRAFELSKANDPGAADFLAQALKDAETKGASDKGLLAEGYFYLGRFRSDAEALPDAERALRRTLSFLDAQGDAGDADLRIDSMVLLGKVVGRQKRAENAVAIFNRAAQLQAKAKGRTSPDRVTTLEYIAITFEAAGQYRAAEYYRRTGLGIAVDTGMDADDIAIYRTALAANLDKQNRKAEADKVRAGEKVIDIEGAMLAALQAGEKLRTDGKTDEAHAHFLKLRQDFAVAADSVLYMLILKDIAETADQSDHAAVAAIYEEAAATEERLYGLTPVGLSEFRYLAAREWAFDGRFERAFKGFDEMDKLGKTWVGREVAERQRAVETIMAAALGRPGADRNCRKVATVQTPDEILFAGYAIEEVMRRSGRNGGRTAALDCSLALAGPKVTPQAAFATGMALGLALVETGQYDRAAGVLGDALAAADKLDRPADEKRMLLTYVALADGWTRKFDEALKLLDRADALPGAGDIDQLSLLRVRAIVYVNATRYPEAEATINRALAVAERIMAARFDDDRAGALKDLAAVLVRAGRAADAFRLIERVGLPRELPADGAPSTFLFYIDIAETRMTLLSSLGRVEEATAAAEVFRTVVLPAADRLLADGDRNSIMAATVAATLNQAALTLVGLGLFSEAEDVADRAATLVSADRSPGVRLLGARIELVSAIAAFRSGDADRALPGFDRAYARAQAIVPAESDEMYEIVAGRGMARLALGQGSAALADLRTAGGIARARIGRETRFNDQGTQRTVRPAFTALVGAAWLASH